eukprot:scaffold71881_cov64-Phaeocystis_antarctica.AAC.6
MRRPRACRPACRPRRAPPACHCPAAPRRAASCSRSRRAGWTAARARAAAAQGCGRARRRSSCLGEDLGPLGREAKLSPQTARLEGVAFGDSSPTLEIVRGFLPPSQLLATWAFKIPGSKLR